MAYRKRALRAGFITLHRDAISHLDHRLPDGVCWTLVKLLALADYENGIVVCSIRGLAIEFNRHRATVSNHLGILKAEGLIDWIVEATNQNLDGQLAIPGFDWLSGVKDAVGPAGPLSTPADAAGTPAGTPGGTQSDPADTLPPAETVPLELQDLQDKTLAPPSADAKELRGKISRAIAAACGFEDGRLTASARGALARAARELREVGADPDEIEVRARRYRAKWPAATLTPSALVKHWPALADKQVSGTTSLANLVYGSDEWNAANRPWEVTA